MEFIMKAVRIIGNKQLKVIDTPVPEIGPRDALVKLQASALCRADLFRYYGTTCFDDDSADSDFTPGHEPCGIVEKVGDKVTNVKEGDRVGLYMFVGCGECEYCTKGYNMLCKDFACIGFQRDGAHADYIVLPAQNCLKMPNKLSYVAGALLTDVGGGLYTACRDLGAKGGKYLAIIGAGPMGCGGVMMAKAFGSRVIVVDIDPKRLDFAKSVGADFAINPKEGEVKDEIMKITGGRGADIAIECTGNEIGAYTAFDVVRPLGKVGIIGEQPTCTIHPSAHVIHKKLTISGCWVFNKYDWEDIVTFVLENNVPIEKLATHKYQIGDAAEAYRAFDSHVAQKVVFVWDTDSTQADDSPN